MIRKKICMLGAAAVGKTSLSRRYVESIFSDEYLSTVGVKIDRKTVTIDGEDLGLVIWDVQGQDDARRVLPSFVKGASGCVLVVDATRPETVAVASEVRDVVLAYVGDVPFVLAINKTDLADPGAIDSGVLGGEAAAVVATSAKTGDGVDAMFETLGRALITPAEEA